MHRRSGLDPSHVEVEVSLQMGLKPPSPTIRLAGAWVGGSFGEAGRVGGSGVLGCWAVGVWGSGLVRVYGVRALGF